MNYVGQIIEALCASAVKRILVVDDAYDPPEFSGQLSGDLVEVLTTDEFRKHVSVDLLREEDLGAAVAALERSEFDDRAITATMERLYHTFVDTRTDAIDPGGTFASMKASALADLDPLLELLGRCNGDVRVRKVGIGNDAAIRAYGEFRPDLIFMDFFLRPTGGTTTAITEEQKERDRERSIRLLKEMLEDGGIRPAVVLMSSGDVANRKDGYLARLDDRMMSLRFGYLYKKWLSGSGTGLVASGDAADVLIDTSGSFEFGRTLEAALNTWKTGADAALQKLYHELRGLDVKDFAYLLRMRLYDEGQPFADYLEWLLGESLRAIVDDVVNWGQDEFGGLDNPKLTQSIMGAHPVPSTRIAEFFHRMRFNSRGLRQRRRFELGDIFIGPEAKCIRMVISPDCDLIQGAGRRGAIRILTVGGEIRSLEEEGTFAQELICRGTPKAIRWNLKDLMTHKFGDVNELEVDGTTYEFMASMRPMAAQVIQKSALADLSRVGIAVPPIVYVGAPVKVFLKTNENNQARLVELKGLGKDPAQVFMPRGGADNSKRALFTPMFVRQFFEILEGIDENDLFPSHRDHLRGCIRRAGDLRENMLRRGLVFPGKNICKLMVSVGGEARGKNWLEIVINVADEALIELQGTDPLSETVQVR